MIQTALSTLVSIVQTSNQFIGTESVDIKNTISMNHAFICCLQLFKLIKLDTMVTTALQKKRSNNPPQQKNAQAIYESWC